MFTDFKAGRLNFECTSLSDDGTFDDELGEVTWLATYQQHYIAVTFYRGPETYMIEVNSDKVAEGGNFKQILEIAKRYAYNLNYAATKAWELGVDAIDYKPYQKVKEGLKFQSFE